MQIIFVSQCSLLCELSSDMLNIFIGTFSLEDTSSTSMSLKNCFATGRGVARIQGSNLSVVFKAWDS